MGLGEQTSEQFHSFSIVYTCHESFGLSLLFFWIIFPSNKTYFINTLENNFNCAYLIPPARNAKTIIVRPWTNGINDGTLATLQTPTNTKIKTTRNSTKQGRTYFMNTEDWLRDELTELRFSAVPFVLFSADLLPFPSIFVVY